MSLQKAKILRTNFLQLHNFHSKEILKNSYKYLNYIFKIVYQLYCYKNENKKNETKQCFLQKKPF